VRWRRRTAVEAGVAIIDRLVADVGGERRGKVIGSVIGSTMPVNHTHRRAFCLADSDIEFARSASEKRRASDGPEP